MGRLRKDLGGRQPGTDLILEREVGAREFCKDSGLTSPDLLGPSGGPSGFPPGPASAGERRARAHSRATLALPIPGAGPAGMERGRGGDTRRAGHPELPPARAPGACPRRPLLSRGGQSPGPCIRLQCDTRCLSAAGSWGCPGPPDRPAGGKLSFAVFGLCHPFFLRPHPILISSGAQKSAESRRPEARQEEGRGVGRGEEGGEGPGDPRDVARVTSEGERGGRARVLAGQSPPKRRLPASPFGGGLSHTSSPAIGRLGASGPLQREKPGGGRSGAFIRPGTTSCPPAPAPRLGSRIGCVPLGTRRRTRVLVTIAAFAPSVHSASPPPLRPASPPLSCAR